MRSEWDAQQREASSYDEASPSRFRRRSRGHGSTGLGGPADGIEFIFCLFLLGFVLVTFRLIDLQMIRAKEYSERALNTRLDYTVIRARRGTIYDRNGNVLAITVDATTIYCNQNEITDPSAVTTLLVKDLGGERSDYLGLLVGDEPYVCIEHSADVEKAKALKKDLEEAELPGVYFDADTKREYPYGDVGGQILGIVGYDGEGLTGLEAYYEDVLKGENGKITMETGLEGTPIAGATSIVDEAVNGADIVTSLDIDVQIVAEAKIVDAVERFKAESGSVMVIDPKTGEILAACSTPLLPITNFNEMEEGSENLKTVTASYEPGSIFKILTSAIGIENGLVTPWSAYVVEPEVRVGDDYVADDDGRDYTMTMSLTEMMRRSSNAGIAMVAQESIGPEVFASGVDAFGIGRETGIDYPGEASGIVRSLDEYDGSTTGSMSFGQGLAVPMVQMVRAVGAVANRGYLVTPHFAIKVGDEVKEWEKGEPILSKETCDEVTQMLRVVVQDGTAVNAAVEGYDVAGKTGTGEQASEEGGYLENSFVSSLVGYAPASDPAVLVYVGLNNTPYLAYGSAAPTFSSIMSEALRDMGIPPEN